jgi:adenylate cyclase
MFASIATALLVVASGAGWWLYRGAATVRPATQASLQSPATTQASTAPNIGIATAPRLSIVVLPFQNLSGDAKEDYLAEGITEDVTTDLSRIQGMFVISRETATLIEAKRSMCARSARSLVCATCLRAACASRTTCFV